MKMHLLLGVATKKYANIFHVPVLNFIYLFILFKALVLFYTS